MWWDLIDIEMICLTGHSWYRLRKFYSEWRLFQKRTMHRVREITTSLRAEKDLLGLYIMVTGIQ